MLKIWCYDAVYFLRNATFEKDGIHAEYCLSPYDYKDEGNWCGIGYFRFNATKRIVGLKQNLLKEEK